MKDKKDKVKDKESKPKKASGIKKQKSIKAIKIEGVEETAKSDLELVKTHLEANNGGELENEYTTNAIAHINSAIHKLQQGIDANGVQDTRKK